MIRFKRTHILAAIVLACCAVARPGASAPEERIAVGAYQVQAAEQGSGRYTVIFESGFGTGLESWRKVAPEVAKSAHVMSYSRAGHGSSDPRPEPRSILESSRELDQLVAAAGLTPPFILVGHSYGGLLARAFALRHPEQVAGMVLVDPADERFNPALRRLDAARAADDDRQFNALVPAKFRAEYDALKPVLDQGALPPPLNGKLPDVPVVVLTSVQQLARPEFFLQSVEAVAVKRDLHADFLRQFSEGSQVLTLRSGHNIQQEEPELVIEAVRKVMAAADGRAAQNKL
ncbi:4,5:9,10-diseco-3-hydroxy-5,9, 17-trioxoandrosta-1(10),2-diene-4-oate hydrolase [Massilia sp. Bi118]|uniref:alpha/beta fold hydrolase n=1 Tax=Massilia sp. Bi118 TaxID=2822346 RepID=UPI001D4576D9|nr:alpha/beta hydrolase [Massilia sp. Bi118]CAH0237413.1 4,5:9,10-diseco-3-hydroxy-5,9, 17-trioxoandrosta-1(10),2-diene-4-oate hydrolase [Massilia sp. Bi118]